MAKIKTQGTELKIENAASPGEFTLIAQVSGIQGVGSGTADDIDVTTFDSAAKEYLQGLPDEGEATFDLVFDPDDVQHLQLISLRNAQQSADFKLVMAAGTNDTFSFTAFVKQVDLNFSTNDAVRASVTLRITGLVTLGTS